jgi:hypothetical protein
MYLKIEYGQKESPVVVTVPVRATWQKETCGGFEVEMYVGEWATVALMDGLPDGIVARLRVEQQHYDVYAIEPLPSIEPEVMAILSRWFEAPLQPLNVEPKLREPVTTGWD